MFWSLAVGLVVCVVVGPRLCPYVFEFCLQCPEICFLLGFCAMVYGSARMLPDSFLGPVCDEDIEPYDPRQNYLDY